MAGFGSVGSDSFEFYEGIRIVIPGAIVVGLFEGLDWAFSGSSPEGLNFVTAIFASIGIGLVAYFVDMPRHSAVYSRDLPSDWFADNLGEELRAGGVEPVNAFFVVSDDTLPGSIRARALYMGAIFRIGFEAIVFIGIAQLLPWLWAIQARGTGMHLRDDYYWWLAAAVAAPLLWPLGVLARSEVRRRISNGQRGVGPRARGFLRGVTRAVGFVREDLSIVDVVAVGSAAALLALGFTHPRMSELTGSRLVVAGVIVLGALWLVRFIFGSASAGVRKPVDRLTSGLLFAAASLTGSIAARHLGGTDFLNRPEPVAAWMGAAILTSVLIASRGPEKRLRGSYSSQRTWLQLNQDAVRKSLGLPVNDGKNPQ